MLGKPRIEAHGGVHRASVTRGGIVEPIREWRRCYRRPPVADVAPMERAGPSERCPTDAPCAIDALPVTRSMPHRSLTRYPIPVAEQEDSGELRESPSVPEQGRGLSRIRHA
jgi:hypothetical protein